MGTKPSLQDVIGTPTEDGPKLRWRATVPIGTNPFILLELFQLAFVGASVVVLTLCSGVWFTEGGITLQDIQTSLYVGCMVLGGVMAGFVALAFLFFKNRYFVSCQMDSTGIYHETTRGSDARKGLFCLKTSPFPILEPVTASRTRSRFLPWHKVNRFQEIASMRVIILYRGRWHMMRLYLPDNACYEQVASFLHAMVKK